MKNEYLKTAWERTLEGKIAALTERTDCSFNEQCKSSNPHSLHADLSAAAPHAVSLERLSDVSPERAAAFVRAARGG